MELLSIYKCGKCGNIVEVLHVGGGPLACCGEPMQLLKENVTDAAQEKHVPVAEGQTIKVGSVAHPMEADHWIEWIQVINEERACRCFLDPGEDPKAMFDSAEPGARVREYCNKHGLWSAKI